MPVDPLTLARGIVDILEDKKGEDILLLDLAGVCSFTDYFILCSAGSERTLKALSGEVQRQTKEDFSLHAQSVEGDASSRWILLDYGDVILHLFSPELRAYYHLEELWKEGQVLVHLR
ncbi:MAG TPA: ribosome silencing factor [Anaerolineales bacterium]|nr:ribosome silencing factor [Anaerolineales bacterium]